MLINLMITAEIVPTDVFPTEAGLMLMLLQQTKTWVGTGPGSGAGGEATGGIPGVKIFETAEGAGVNDFNFRRRLRSGAGEVFRE